MKIILIAALMFMGCATTKPVKTVEPVSEIEQIEYVTSLIGEEMIEHIVIMLEYNPVLSEKQLEMIVGKELMATLKKDKQILAWLSNE